MTCVQYTLYMQEIYPEQLELKNENISSTKTSFPDFIPEINKIKIPIKPFNKRDSFQFEVMVCVARKNSDRLS